jgi:16S rRNA (guanine966-N2)-methyltransferase
LSANEHQLAQIVFIEISNNPLTGTIPGSREAKLKPIKISVHSRIMNNLLVGWYERAQSRMNRGRKPANQIRIIGGTHRGRRLPVPDLPGLRPTGDRIRETLFNWLQAHIPGAACLDLFAGSGALGLEAASRGAGRVVMLEQAAAAAQQLRKNAELLGERQVRIEQADALQWLQGQGEPFDIVFLDPPFADDLLETCCERLHQNGWLRLGALVYIETPVDKGIPQLPESWSLVQQKKTGQVAYYLARTG